MAGNVAFSEKFKQLNADLLGEIETLITSLQKVADDAKGQVSKALTKGSRPIIKAARKYVPVSKKPHERYKDGVLVAIYRPGNLRDSVKAMRFRRAKNSIFIGPVVADDPVGFFGPDGGQNDAGQYVGKSTRVDGWYANFVHYGTESQSPVPFMRKAADEAGRQGLEIVVKELKKSILESADRAYRKSQKKRR